MEEALEAIARRYRVPKNVLKDAYRRGIELAEKILPWFERTAEKVREYHKQGYEVLTLGRDMLPLNLLLVLKNVPVKNLGISSGTAELAVYTYELSSFRNIDERIMRKAFERFKQSEGYEKLRRVLKKIVKGDKVLVVDTGYRGTHAWLVAEILKGMGKEARPMLIVGKKDFPGEKVHTLEEVAEKLGVAPEDVVERVIDAIETGEIKPLMPYREINRSQRIGEDDDYIFRFNIAHRIAAWLGFVKRVREKYAT